MGSSAPLVLAKGIFWLYSVVTKLVWSVQESSSCILAFLEGESARLCLAESLSLFKLPQGFSKRSLQEDSQPPYIKSQSSKRKGAEDANSLKG